MALWSCSDVPSEPPPRPSISPTDPLRWSDSQRTAYEQCLQDNMAVAMAWEAIEQSCKDQVSSDGNASGLPSETP